MPVYVDEFGPKFPVKWRGGGHMVADTHEELEAIARRLNLNPAWIQRPGTVTEHYDLVKSKRALAVHLGAKEITSREGAAITERKIAQRDAIDQVSKGATNA